MNRLDTNVNGGFPWTLDDFRFENEQQREALHAICQGLLGDPTANARVVGVEITGSGTNLDVSAGYLVVAGELIRVDAHQVPNIELGGDYYHVTIAETPVPSTTKTLEDGGTHEARIQRRATIENGSFPVGSDVEFNTTNFPTLPEAILSATDAEYSGAWTQLAATALTLEPASIVTAVSGQFRFKKVGRIAFIQYKLVVSYSSTNGLLIVTLPSAIPPAYESGFGVTSCINGNGDDMLCKVFIDSGVLNIKKYDDTVFNVTGDLTFEGSHSFETAL